MSSYQTTLTSGSYMCMYTMMFIHVDKLEMVLCFSIKSLCLAVTLLGNHQRNRSRYMYYYHYIALPAKFISSKTKVLHKLNDLPKLVGSQMPLDKLTLFMLQSNNRTTSLFECLRYYYCTSECEAAIDWG